MCSPNTCSQIVPRVCTLVLFIIAVLNTLQVSVDLVAVLSPQASQSASAGVVEVKEAHIAALQTEMKGKDRLLQAKPKVGAGVSSTAPHVHTHMHNV